MLKKLLRASTKAICHCQHVHNFLLLISHLITTNSTSCTVRFFRFFEELGYHIALGVDLVGFSRHSSVMVLLSLLSEVPALRFFVVVVLTTCAYIVHKQSASKPVKNFPHETAVHEVLLKVRSSRHKKHHTHLSHQILLSRPTTSHLGNSITNVASVSTLRPAHTF
jgi:hypothetical protein